ncbi:MAG TPA: hypothetical protein VMF29_01840 [Candidatus Edwardsbacteria bacterium]|nr:hypothetical protein [Candidatus Edwardsbacteria bacterium]
MRWQDAKGIIVADDREGSAQSFYIVEPAQLLKAHKVSSLTYLGSTEKYCLMRVWPMLAVNEDEIDLFAVDRASCVVENEQSPSQEFATHRYRPVEIENGKCIVREMKGNTP